MNTPPRLRLSPSDLATLIERLNANFQQLSDYLLSQHERVTKLEQQAQQTPTAKQ